MGFLDKVKGWLNIGGPKVSITEVHQPVVGKSGTVTGQFEINTPREAKLLKCIQKFICVETTGEGENKSETTNVIGEVTTDTPMDIRPNIRWTGPIHIPYDLTGTLDKMAAKGGLMGALGKVGQFASGLGEKGTREYFVEVTCDIQGTPFDPSDKISIEASID